MTHRYREIAFTVARCALASSMVRTICGSNFTGSLLIQMPSSTCMPRASAIGTTWSRPCHEGRALMDLSLTEDQLAFRDLARDFLEREAFPHRMQWDHDESVDLAIVPKMAALGFFGLTIAERAAEAGRKPARVKTT